MTTIKHLEFKRGALWRLDFALKDREGAALLVDPATDTVTFRLVQDGEGVLELAIGDGITMTDAPAGEGTVLVTDSVQDAVGVSLSEYDYEVFYDSPVRGYHPQIEGKLMVLPTLKELVP